MHLNRALCGRTFCHIVLNFHFIRLSFVSSLFFSFFSIFRRIAIFIDGNYIPVNFFWDFRSKLIRFKGDFILFCWQNGYILICWFQHRAENKELSEFNLPNVKNSVLTFRCLLLCRLNGA